MHLTVERTNKGWAVISEAASDNPHRMSAVFRTYDEASAARLRIISDIHRAEADFQCRIERYCGLR